MKRAALFCTGRGSYTERSLGSLQADHPYVERAEELRAELGLSSLVELDRAERFQASQHLTPSNVSPMIFLITMIDADVARSEHRLVCVGGNSLGWYSALAVAGALSFDDGFRLVQLMSILQQEHADAGANGGQLLYPIVDEEWQLLPERVTLVDRVLLAANGEAFHSIRLGGHAVLAGSEAGMAQLLAELPQVTLGATTYPLRLFKHGPYHTPLQAPVAEEAYEQLGELGFRMPVVNLIDGRGVQHSTFSADPAELRDYTLGAQITTTYDFTSSVRVALREYGPDCIVLPGPGNALGSVCGQILCSEGYRGVKRKSELAGGELILSMRR